MVGNSNFSPFGERSKVESVFFAEAAIKTLCSQLAALIR